MSIPLVAYDDIRPRLRTGDAIWTADASWLSKAIRWGTKSHVSHMGIVYRTAPFVLMLESVKMGNVNGIGITRLSSKIQYMQSLKGGRLFVGILSDDIRFGLDEAAMVSTMQALRGTRYDGWQAFWSWCKLPFRWQSPTRMFCSEAVAYTYSQHGVLSPSYPYSKATPQDGWKWPVFQFQGEIA